jgi:hypothetical protein
MNSNNILICQGVNPNTEFFDEINKFKECFHGTVYTDVCRYESHLNANVYFINKKNGNIYICGDIGTILENRVIRKKLEQVIVIDDLSYHINDMINILPFVTQDEVPINIHNMGIFIKECFDDTYYDLIKQQHQFQSLTHSNKDGLAFRSGIYLTDVKLMKNMLDDLDEMNVIKFNLLRCSTNLSGPTDNFRDVDNKIIDKLNNIANIHFESCAKLNHVLVQEYENKKVITNDKVKERKARIAAHADKTKDMPEGGIMAFCTFYKDIFKYSKSSDYCYKGNTVLTRLQFKLKDCVAPHPKYKDLIKKFEITLYPNSVFMMPLSTNKLYTHEIMPSLLPIDMIPTRIGYVVRCSETEALFKNDQTYIIKDGKEIKLDKFPTNDDFGKLKYLYAIENLTDETVDYTGINFSMNSGDYKRPIL